MLTFEESASEQRIKIFDRRAVTTGYGDDGVSAAPVAVHKGDIYVPVLPPGDPLLAQCAHFVDCVRTGSRPRTDGAHGLAVVRVLEAGQHSIRAGGAPTFVP
jgi:predicted dehydrogenase